MFKELIKDLRHCATSSEACASCNRKNQRHCQDHLHAEAADAIERLEETAPKWIPVTERLPDVWSDVLVAVLKHRPKSEPVRTMEVDFITMTGEWAKMSCDRWNEVTHWMPLPEPPKEE